MNDQALPRIWGSLSLRLSAVFVAMLVTAALAVGYLFDRGRAEALEQRELGHLRLHAERGADEVERFVRQLRGDVLFLADTPPIQGIVRALEAEGVDAVGSPSLSQWKEWLQQIFRSFAEARPEYFQIRLIGLRDGGRELVRVERTGAGLLVTPPDALQRKGDRYYFTEALEIETGKVYLSRIDLNREHGRIGIPYRPTIRAATPIRGVSGKLFGVLVVNMDMEQAFARVESYRSAGESLYIADEQGNFLLHPEPERAFAFELGAPYRIADAFAGRVPDTLAEGTFIAFPGPGGKSVAYVTERSLDPADPNRRLVYILAEPQEQLSRAVGLKRRDSLLGMGALLALAIVLVIFMVRWQTHALRVLARAAATIAKGDFRVVFPAADRGEIGSLVLAFRHMAAQVEKREELLADLNWNLELRVEERTRELARQHNLQQLILENIADGIIVSDCDGHFLLWNRKAEQMVGSGPEDIPPARWSSHFGVFRDESGEPMPVEELPLVRAIRGEATADAELYLRHPKRTEGRWVLITARPLHGADGGVSGAVAVLMDVTERKRLQERIQGHSAELAKVGRLALSVQIASSTAHQLSQPIAALSNYSAAAVRLLGQGRLHERELSEILARIERLATQCGAILDKLRARIRRRQPAPAAVDVNQVAAACLHLLGDRLGRQGVRVRRHFATGLPMPCADPIELEQVLLQLITNALESMEGIERGERRLLVATGHDPVANLVWIQIGDTGPGVSAGISDRVFEPWETDKPDALGIGLSIAQTIVETFGGRLRMESDLDRGASFRVELPVTMGMKE